MTYFKTEELSLAKQWFLNSGIQNLDKSEPEFGSINAWFDNEKDKYSFAYSEITGYGITTFIFLNKIFNETELIKRAEIAADWLTNYSVHPNIEGYRCRFDLEKKVFSPARVCSFDNAMCLNGLVNLFKETRKQKYLEEGLRIGKFLIEKMQKSDGSFHVRFDGETGRALHSYDTWSTQSGSFHAKNSIGLLNLFSVTGDDKYKDSAIKVGEWIKKLQQADGRFVTHIKEGFVHIHPHSYTLEGMLALGLLCERPDFIEIVVKGLDFSLNMELGLGGISCFYKDHKLPYERVDALAQTIRLSILGIRHGLKIDEKKLDIMVTHLKSFQINYSEKKELKGSFIYGHTEEGQKLEHANSWVTMFSLQSLELYEQFKKNSLDFDITLLI